MSFCLELLVGNMALEVSQKQAQVLAYCRVAKEKNVKVFLLFFDVHLDTDRNVDINMWILATFRVLRHALLIGGISEYHKQVS